MCHIHPVGPKDEHQIEAAIFSDGVYAHALHAIQGELQEAHGRADHAHEGTDLT